MAPVAVLIFVRPGVEVNTIECNPLHPDGNGGHGWAHFPIEAVLIHAKIGGRVAEPNKAGWRCSAFSYRAQLKVSFWYESGMWQL